MSSTEAALVLTLLLPYAVAAAHPRVTGDVTFDRDVIRIVRVRCVPCHEEGGGAVPLTSYSAARPYARAIRDEVLARRMPPWPPQPGVGDFEDDGALSAHAAAVLIAWAEGGAPEGDAADLPPGETTPPRAPQRTRPIEGARVLLVRDTATPSGERLVGLRPLAARGANIEVDLLRDGRVRPLLWIQRFDPGLPYLYRLREPIDLKKGDRVRVRGGSVQLSLLAPSARPAR